MQIERTRVSPFQRQRLIEFGSTINVEGATYAVAKGEIERLAALVNPTHTWLKTWKRIALQFRELGGELRIKMNGNKRSGYIRFQYPGQDWQIVKFWNPSQALHESDGVRLWQYAGGFGV